MAAKRLSEIERAYFTRQTGDSNPQEPLGQLKRRYYADFLDADAGATFNELETDWKVKFITDNGGTVISTYDPDLWVQMVLAISEVPTKRMQENKMIFYLNAP